MPRSRQHLTTVYTSNETLLKFAACVHIAIAHSKYYYHNLKTDNNVSTLFSPIGQLFLHERHRSVFGLAVPRRFCKQHKIISY